MIIILKKQSTFLSYLDMNNLYVWAMSEYLPYEGFKWLENADEFNVMLIIKKCLVGYLLEVDLEYSNKLQELHSDYPPAPKNLLFLVICC